MEEGMTHFAGGRVEGWMMMSGQGHFGDHAFQVRLSPLLSALSTPPIFDLTLSFRSF